MIVVVDNFGKRTRSRHDTHLRVDGEFGELRIGCQTSKELEGDTGRIYTATSFVSPRQGLPLAFGSGKHKGVRRTCPRSDDANDRRKRRGRGYGGNGGRKPGSLVWKRSAKLRRMEKSVWPAMVSQSKLCLPPSSSDVNDPSMFRVERGVVDEPLSNPFNGFLIAMETSFYRGKKMQRFTHDSLGRRDECSKSCRLFPRDSISRRIWERNNT